MKYEKYKPSGIDWIGDVPEHWDVKRLKNLATNVSTKSPEISDDDFLVALENIESNTGQFIESSTEYENNGIAFKKSHLLYNKLRPYLNKVYLAERDGICVGDIIVVECSKKLLPKFLQYKMLSDAFCSVVMSSVQGTKMPRTSWEFISSLKFGIPTPDEQLTIAHYLDDQTQKIDRLIANKKAQAEKLKELRQIEINNAVTKGLNPKAEMKDSGIEWLGKIPKNWTTKRMKDVASVRGRIGFRGYTVDDIVDEGALVIGAKHINGSNQLNFNDPEYISWEKYYESPEIMVEVGDVLIVQRGSVGKFALVEKEIGSATINPSMILLRLNARIHPQFLFWYLLGEHMFNIIKTIVSSTAVPMISQMQAGVFRIILPPKKEQIEIANYLQERITSIDQLIKNIETQIEQLQELRKVRIYEAVTGKIKVNAYAEATA